ncbi:LOW QUALITY PROTEIN: uncharacterized protein [Drosophila takahashii]|uniref:LOW QUALITY PROTEIN: uncharacterized protein n=1 Tax=Drosophila takahashii TaxID=29030 RepID=UPI001CF82D2C|nr:LOW QUALITY PROTEIN: uncharacterized protein LOC108058905 [Drosophila takahashii]
MLRATHLKKRENAIVEYFDYRIPVTQLIERPVWACTIKVSVAAMSGDPALHLPLSFTTRIPLFLFSGKYVHTSNAMYYSDLFCLPIKPKVKRKKDAAKSK